MYRRPPTWLSSSDAILHLQRQYSELGGLAEQIVDAAIRSPSVRRRARTIFDGQLRDMDWALPVDAEIVVYSGTVLHHRETIYDSIEVERRDLDAFAVGFGFPSVCNCPAKPQAQAWGKRHGFGIPVGAWGCPKNRGNPPIPPPGEADWRSRRARKKPRGREKLAPWLVE